jgi:vancomycin resistance protein YoaR
VSRLRTSLKISFTAALLLLYAAPAALWCWICRIDDRTRYILLDGQPIGDDAKQLKLLIQKKTAQFLSRTVTLRGNEQEVSLPLESLGFVPDVKGTMESIDRIREHRDDPIHELSYVLELRRGGFNVTPRILLDGEVAAEVLLELKDRLDRDPVNARIGWQDGVHVIEEQSGRILDLYGSLSLLEEEVLRNKRDSIELSFIPVEPDIRANLLSYLGTEKTISEYTTKFSRGGKDNANRAYNIELAADYLDGTVILPGYMISFNKIVGPRSLLSGFREAPEIYEGEMVAGVGGGVCQVASTLHAAAFLAGLDIVEHVNHSRPSSYITMGLDATVVWPVLDLKIRNPFPFPVMIRTAVDKNRLSIEILGGSKPVEVKWWKNVLEVLPFEDSIEYDESLPPGEIVVEQEGINGYRIKKTRKLTFQDGTEKTETEVEFYPPTVQLLRMAPGTEYVPVQEREEEKEGEDEDEEQNPYL